VAPGTLQATVPPTIQGTPEVGQTLTLSDTSWSPQPSRTTTQWYADGAPIDEATGTTLVLSRSMIDRRISARVIGSAQGYRKLTSNAPETAPVLAKAIKVMRSFRVKGRPQLARVLVARAGDVRPSNASAAYAWLRDGTPISNATNRAYTVRPKDIGRSLSLQVTLTRTHFRDGPGHQYPLHASPYRGCSGARCGGHQGEGSRSAGSDWCDHGDGRWSHR